MFQCFATKNIWPGIFTFSLTLFQFVAKRFETFQISDLVIFGSVSICFETCPSENLEIFNKFIALYILYVSMFQCFTETNACPGISAGVLCRL